MAYTVKQLADLAGVSRRTLHYYDEIGLLHPSHVGGNGYRYYDEEAILRLQQILFLRELDLSLEEIGQLLDRPDFDLLQTLQTHRQALQKRVHRLQRLIQTIDKTTLHLQGQLDMSTAELFESFTAAEEQRYAQEAGERYDPAEVRRTYQRWNSYPAEKKARIRAAGEAIYRDILAHMDQGADSPAVQAAIARWHQHMRYFYEPSLERLRGLGQMYAADPTFSERFRQMHPDFPEFLRQAIAHYCHTLETQ